MPQLSIIIVNYRSRRLLDECLEKLRQFTTSCDYEVIVVNNDPEPQDWSDVEASGARVIQSGYNAGFARANNLGIKASEAPFVLLMNPDVFVKDDAICQCLNRFNGSPYSGAGVQLLNEDDTKQVTGSYFMTGGLNHFLPLPVIGRLFKALGNLLGAKKTSVASAEKDQEVDWINGAFLMVKRSHIQRAGLLDEDFFLYAEEIEWCARLRKLAPMVVYGDLNVYHLQGEVANASFKSTGKGYYNLFDKKGRQILVSNFLRIRKQFGPIWFVIHLLIYTAELPLFFFYCLVNSILGRAGYGFREWSGYLRNLVFLYGWSGKMIRNQPHFYKVL